jgi:predicted aldo/keto reductase-like oxidoreductase
MQYRILGKTGLRVSEVGYGGGRVRPNQDQPELIKAIQRMIDAGINYFDTAPTYGSGTSEIILGNVIKPQRDKCLIATKTEAYDPEGIIKDLEGSLKRLQTDFIDILQFHGGWFLGNEADEILNRGGLETYKRLKAEGKVRFIGFSADGPSTGVSKLIATGEFDMFQVHYNLMYQNTYDGFSRRGIIADAKSQSMGIVTMRSTTSGAFQKLMRTCFPGWIPEADIEAFLLNYTLSNPLVDVALMSIQSMEEVEKLNKISDNTSARIDIREVHRR